MIIFFFSKVIEKVFFHRKQRYNDIKTLTSSLPDPWNVTAKASRRATSWEFSGRILQSIDKTMTSLPASDHNKKRLFTVVFWSQTRTFTSWWKYWTTKKAILLSELNIFQFKISMSLRQCNDTCLFQPTYRYDKLILDWVLPSYLL